MSGLRRAALAWAFYDWANSAFATAIIAGFFPVFFKHFWAGGLEAARSTFYLGISNAAASVLIAFIAPVLGAVADRGATKKRFMLLFASLGIAMTSGLYLASEGQWALAMTLYILATLGFMGGNIFYDALIVAVAEEEEYHRISALGFALGYLGGGIVFAFCVLMTVKPVWFGFADSAVAVRFAFLLVALWWALFSLPVFLLVREPGLETRRRGLGAVRAGIDQLVSTFRQVRQLRVVFVFLGAYWLYIDGVGTIVRMAVDYGMSLGLNADDLMLALLITQFVGFPAAIVFGRVGTLIGPKRAIMIGLAVYVMVTVWGGFMRSNWEFYAIAVIIGLVQGGVQSLSRSLYARIIPPSQAGEFFGFYNMLGKFAAVLGPLMMGWIAMMTGSPRLSILSLVLLFVAGGVLLACVDEDAGHRTAVRLEGEGP